MFVCGVRWLYHITKVNWSFDGTDDAAVTVAQITKSHTFTVAYNGKKVGCIAEKIGLTSGTKGETAAFHAKKDRSATSL